MGAYLQSSREFCNWYRVSLNGRLPAQAMIGLAVSLASNEVFSKPGSGEAEFRIQGARGKPGDPLHLMHTARAEMCPALPGCLAVDQFDESLVDQRVSLQRRLAGFAREGLYANLCNSR